MPLDFLVERAPGYAKALSGVIDIPVLSLQDSCDVQAFDLQEGQVSTIVARMLRARR